LARGKPARSGPICFARLAGSTSTDRPYRAGRSPDWVKVKNRQHPAMNRDQRFPIGTCGAAHSRSFLASSKKGSGSDAPRQLERKLGSSVLD
jgi:hypothetical protein